MTQAQHEQVTGKNPSQFRGEANPVEMMSWDDAMEFCRALSKKTGKTVRLPTEAEWEYACRAGTTTAYCFGDDAAQLNEYAWAFRFDLRHAQSVAQKKPNAFGLFDMHGNVDEICADGGTRGGYTTADTDPFFDGPGSEMRGGHWALANAPRSALRADYGSTIPYPYQGFRPAKSVAP
jgi:formylglycine-generating enzyme required for sulfatase activity